MKPTLNVEKCYIAFVRLAVVLGVVVSIGSSAFMFANKDIAPDWDMVNVIDFLLGGVGGIAPHVLTTDLFDFTINEHQPYLAMLIWGLDGMLFNSYGLLPQILMQVFAVVTVVLVIGGKGTARPSWTSVAITISGCALILSPMNWENLVWPNQVHLYLSVLFSVLALSVAVSVAKLSWQHQIRSVLLCCFLAVCATYSFGWGLAVWPALLIHGLSFRWRWQANLTVLLVGVVIIALYFSRVSFTHHDGGTSETVFDLISVVHFAALQLAAPLVFDGFGYTITYTVGYLFFGVFAYVCFNIYIRRQVIDDRQMRSLLVCLYCIGVCFLTALGRDSLASRYMLIPILFMVALPGLFPVRVPLESNGKRLIIVGFLLWNLGLSGASFLFDDALRSRQFMIKDGAIAAAFETKANHRGLSPDQDRINERVWPYYIEHHGDSPAINILTWLGKPLPENVVAAVSADGVPSCLGSVDLFENREGDPEIDIINGWVRLGPEGEREAEWVIITNTEGIVVGLGATGRDRPDVASYLKATWFDNLSTKPNRAGFSGLIRSQPGDELNLYAFKDGECCLFASHVIAPDAE